MARFRKKGRRQRVGIDAIRLSVQLAINTKEGCLVGYPGDWLVKDAEGEEHLIEDDVFRQTY